MEFSSHLQCVVNQKLNKICRYQLQNILPIKNILAIYELNIKPLVFDFCYFVFI